MSIVYKGFTEEELDRLHEFLVSKAETIDGLIEYYSYRPICTCEGWGCWGCCSSEAEIRAKQGIPF